MVVADLLGQERGIDSEAVDLAEFQTVESFMQKVFRKDTTDKEEVSSTTVPAPRPDPDFEETGNLVERASKAIELLAARCEILEDDVAQAEVRAAEQDEAVERWKKLALEMKNQTALQDQRLAAMTVRCEAAEARVTSYEKASTIAAQRAATAETLSTKLRGQVVAAFGTGSRVHSVLEAVVLQDAAE